MGIARPSAPSLLAAITAFLLPIAFNPAALAGFWSAKMAVLLMAGFAGLPALISVLRSPSRSGAYAAAGFLGVAAIATAFASTPLAATVGLYNWGNGLLFVTGCVGVWALGRTVPILERSLVMTALLIGIGMSSVIAVLQAVDLVNAEMLQAGTRASGLSGNAARLATLAAGVVAVAAFSARLRPAWIAVAASGAIIVQLTGTRSALLTVAAVAVVGAARAGWRAGVLLVAGVVAATLAGSWIAELGELTTATDRSAMSETALVSGGASSNVRLEIWAYARHAIAREPIIGHGPGRFLAATLQDRTLRAAQLEGDDVFTDAHNIVVEHLVTVGVLGTCLLLLWLALAFRQARGPFAWFAGALFAMSLFQPMASGTTPLAFLALGLAGPVVHRSRLPKSSLLLGGVAIVGAVGLMFGDMQLKRAVDLDVDAARRANVLLRPWPEPAAVLGSIHVTDRNGGRQAFDNGLRWYREALRRDPDHFRSLIRLADLERRAGQLAAAQRHYRKALANDPWSRPALRSLAEMALERCDLAEARRYATRALRIRPDDDLEDLRTRSSKDLARGQCRRPQEDDA